jgi:nitrogen fixation NifU-like protein
MALYSDKVMDHFQHPRNVGKMEDADGVGEVGNAKCGDIMRMYIKVDKDTQTIRTSNSTPSAAAAPSPPAPWPPR